jgi:hypothetical protein
MMRAWIFLALWAALPAPGQVGSIALYTEFEHQPSPVVVQALREEVASLMAPGGLRFEWRALPADDRQVTMELAVVAFKGQCGLLSPAGNFQPEDRLGWSHMSDGVMLPFADVDCGAVRAFVDKSLNGMPAQSREKIFGRAIGRVLAHELLHVFARTAHHSSHGVDQPAFSVDELLADRLVFEGRWHGLHILRLSPAAAPQDAPGSPPAGRATYLREGCGACHGTEGEGTRRAPSLRAGGRILDSVILAAKLAKSENTMCRRAQSLKVAQPSLAEEELPNLVSFLNGAGR